MPQLLTPTAPHPHNNLIVTVLPIYYYFLLLLHMIDRHSD